MGFKEEVAKVLPGAYEDGLQALDKKDHARVKCSTPRQLAGSVNLDKAWLKKWLRDKAPALRQLTARDGYVWIASGGVAIPKGSRHARLLINAGLSFPQEHLQLK